MMTYQGKIYSSQVIGNFVTPHSDSLTPIGTHDIPVVNRDEFVTLVDPWMLEAFQAYPKAYAFHALEGWSRSYYTTEGHVQSISNYQKRQYANKPLNVSMQQTDNYCQQYFKSLPRVKSLDFNTQLRDVPFEPDSSPGIGMPGKKGTEGNLERAIRQANATVNECMRNNTQTVILESTPDAGFTRTQLTKLTDGLKVRNVFGQAFQYILIEGCSAYPLMEMFCQTDTFFFCGKDPRIHVPILLENAMLNHERMISLDWSSFDSSAEPWEINDAFDLLESILDFPNVESRAAFDFARIFFINRKIAAPNFIVYFKERGVPSGSFFTMLIDSIINWRRILYLHHRAYEFFPPLLKTQGDDSFIGTSHHVKPEGLLLQIPEDTTWSLNPAKCPSDDTPSTVPFLQRRLKWGNQARDVQRVERLAIYPEYEVPNPVISGYRARALFEDCNYESHILGWSANYLETKYGTIDPREVPRRFKSYHEVFFPGNTKP